MRNTYIHFLTARGGVFQVAAFGVGGDYIIKPIGPRALLERIKATLDGKDCHNLHFRAWFEAEQLDIDRPSYSVYLGSMPLKLALKEFEWLFTLQLSPPFDQSRNILILGRCMKKYPSP